MTPLYRKRLFVNRFNLAMSLATMAFGMAFLLWILGVLFCYEGFAALSPTLFTQMTPPPGAAGGLANAIFGSIVIVGVATFISTPIGILAGIYLAEFGKDGWLASATRFINDILLSAPSIVIGLFVYTVYVAQVQHFSGWAGSFALALIARAGTGLRSTGFWHPDDYGRLCQSGAQPVVWGAGQGAACCDREAGALHTRAAGHPRRRPAAQRRAGLRAPGQRGHSGDPFAPDFAHAVTRHKLIEAIERSSAEGKSVRLP